MYSHGGRWGAGPATEARRATAIGAPGVRRLPRVGLWFARNIETRRRPSRARVSSSSYDGRQVISVLQTAHPTQQMGCSRFCRGHHARGEGGGLAEAREVASVPDDSALLVLRGA